MNELTILFLVFISSIIGAVGSLFLKKGSSKLKRNLLKHIFDIIKNYDLWIGVTLFLLSSVFYIWALKNARLSLIYPITSLTYIWVSFLSVKFLGEKMNKFKWAGIMLIIVGVFLITR